MTIEILIAPVTLTTAASASALQYARFARKAHKRCDPEYYVEDGIKELTELRQRQAVLEAHLAEVEAGNITAGLLEILRPSHFNPNWFNATAIAACQLTLLSLILGVRCTGRKEMAYQMVAIIIKDKITNTKDEIEELQHNVTVVARANIKALEIKANKEFSHQRHAGEIDWYKQQINSAVTNNIITVENPLQNKPTDVANAKKIRQQQKALVTHHTLNAVAATGIAMIGAGAIASMFGSPIGLGLLAAGAILLTVAAGASFIYSYRNAINASANSMVSATGPTRFWRHSTNYREPLIEEDDDAQLAHAEAVFYHR